MKPMHDAAAERLRVFARGRARLRRVISVAGAVAAVGVTVWSAILAKEARSIPVLANIQRVRAAGLTGFVQVDDDHAPASTSSAEVTRQPASADSSVAATPRADDPPYANDPGIRWFNGRPARPARTMAMTVTAYSPDAKSCGSSADGLTATLHTVSTNGFALVAADPRVLPYGTMISVPGYEEGMIVPVLDCGAAIKGRKLDLLFPTDKQAMKWGRQTVKVTVWEYADGSPRDNPRTER